MKPLRPIALASFIVAYIMVIGTLALPDLYTSFTPSYMFAMWAIGIVAEISNVLLANRLNLKTWMTVLLAISGSVWFFIIFLNNYIGLPFLIVFFLMGIYLHFIRKKVR